MNWLEEVYLLVEKNKKDSACDLVFDTIDDLLLKGKFAKVDAILTEIDVNRLDTFLIVGFLSITLAARDKLKNRGSLVLSSEQRLKELAPDRIEGLLSGLR